MSFPLAWSPVANARVWWLGASRSRLKSAPRTVMMRTGASPFPVLVCPMPVCSSSALLRGRMAPIARGANSPGMVRGTFSFRPSFARGLPTVQIPSSAGTGWNSAIATLLPFATVRHLKTNPSLMSCALAGPGFRRNWRLCHGFRVSSSLAGLPLRVCWPCPPIKIYPKRPCPLATAPFIAPRVCPGSFVPTIPAVRTRKRGD